MISGIDHNGIFTKPKSVYRIENTANLFIQVGYEPIVFTELITNDFRLSWPICKTFIAPLSAYLTVIKRMLWKKILWKWWWIVIVHLPD